MSGGGDGGMWMIYPQVDKRRSQNASGVVARLGRTACSVCGCKARVILGLVEVFMLNGWIAGG